MAVETAQELLWQGITTLDLPVVKERVPFLCRYIEQLNIWSKKMNLIGKNQDLPQVVENHFLDSLLLLRALPEHGCVLADVGTGAGFPGLVCKVAQPELELVLIEPRQKRVTFLKHMIRQLGLAGVKLYGCRVEELSDPVYPTHVTSRAVAEIGDFLQMVLPLLGQDTRMLCMKGPRWQQELDAAQEQLLGEKLYLENNISCLLPFSKAERAILSFCRR